MLKHGVLSLVLFGLLLVVAAGLFRTIPMAFLPDEDQGYFITVAAPRRSLEKTDGCRAG